MRLTPCEKKRKRKRKIPPKHTQKLRSDRQCNAQCAHAIARSREIYEIVLRSEANIDKCTPFHRFLPPCCNEERERGDAKKGWKKSRWRISIERLNTILFGRFVELFQQSEGNVPVETVNVAVRLERSLVEQWWGRLSILHCALPPFFLAWQSTLVAYGEWKQELLSTRRSKVARIFRSRSDFYFIWTHSRPIFNLGAN